jgi:hypothetical protein
MWQHRHLNLPFLRSDPQALPSPFSCCFAEGAVANRNLCGISVEMNTTARKRASGASRSGFVISAKSCSRSAALTSLKVAAEHPGDVIAQARFQDQSGARHRRSSGGVAGRGAGIAGGALGLWGRPGAAHRDPGVLGLRPLPVLADMLLEGAASRMLGSPSYFAASIGGAALETVKRHVEQQRVTMATDNPSTLAREAAMQPVRNAEDCASNIQCATR